MMRNILLAFVFGLASIGGLAEATGAVHPFEIDADGTPLGTIDRLVFSELEERGIEPALLSSDEVFMRRVYLDVIGGLPEAEELRRFQRDRSPDKRAKLIDELLEREEFADYWSLRWCDVLRVKAEFPINLWPNAVQAYHRWIWQSIRDNTSYDEFVHEMLSASGSNFRVPQVNFYRAIQGSEPETIASAVALSFMGARIDGWPEEHREGMAAFFSRVAYKNTAEWKEEIVFLDPAPADELEAVFPDGKVVRIQPGGDPRRVFADWLVAPDNPWFARAVVNRVWFWIFGRGIIHEPDDIRPDNPPSNPELLAYLERELVEADFDLRHLYRLILTSRVYQQSSIPRSDHLEAELLLAHYPVRRLDAEVLIDALCWVYGTGERYSSVIPEPYTFIPEHERTVSLADGSITSTFLETFGRPARDTGLASERSNTPTDSQRLHLLNSTHIQNMINQSPWLRRLYMRSQRDGDGRRVVDAIYMRILSRPPTQGEVAAVVEYSQRSGLEPVQVANDLSWALINTKEFLYRH
jgi:hypothetical protein